MSLTKSKVTVLEQCQVSPPSGSVGDKSLPLVFFDLPWIHYYSPLPSLLFYDFPHSTDYFLQTIVPKFKHSLSLALKHFFPLAGNLILYPSDTPTKPEIRYLEGDSVLLTFAQCTSNDFNYLSGKTPRKVEDLLPLSPQFPSSTILVPLLTIQITLFPNYGICIGSTNNHVVADANSVVLFMRAWASITKHGSDEPFLAGGSLPFYDRTVVKDSKGLYDIFWSQTVISQEFSTQLSTPNNKVRVSYVFTRRDVDRLKKLVDLPNVSSLVVVCGYVWSCMAKLRAANGEVMEDDKVEHFMCPADCRSRLDPPVPINYFGNCLAPFVATLESIKLIGEEGFKTGARAIGQAIKKMLNDEEGVLKGADMWYKNMEVQSRQGTFGVVGSPKFSFSDLDFGLGMGRAKKCEVGRVDDMERMSLDVCRDAEEGFEIGLCLANDRVAAFGTIFANGLKFEGFKE